MFIKVHEFKTDDVKYINANYISIIEREEGKPTTLHFGNIEDAFITVRESAEDIFKMLSAE